MSEDVEGSYTPVFEDGKQLVSNESAKLERHWSKLEEGEAAASREWLVAHDQDKPQAKELESTSPARETHREAPPPIPTWHENPLGHAVGTAQQLHNENEQLKDYVRFAIVANSANGFKQRAPDYDAAVNYLIETERRNARIAGVTDEQFEQSVMNSLLAISQRGLDPAETVYKLARDRGFDVGHAYDLLPDDALDEHWKALEANARKERHERGLKRIRR